MKVQKSSIGIFKEYLILFKTKNMTKVKEMPNVAEEVVNEEATLSKEELEQRRKEITVFYKENIKNLKVQLEYEKLLTDIEKTRAQIFVAQTYAQQNANAAAAGDTSEAAEEFETAKEGRTLKRKADETA